MLRTLLRRPCKQPFTQFRFERKWVIALYTIQVWVGDKSKAAFSIMQPSYPKELKAEMGKEG
jgi:hypothetical protein